MHRDAAADLGSIASKVASILDETGHPGAAIALIIDGEPAMVEGVGHGDLERTDVMQPDGRFPLYSITKTFLAGAIIRLVEDGRLELDASINAILQNDRVNPSITIRQLLNHTSGLPDYSTLPGYGEDLRLEPGQPWTDDEFLDRTLRQGYLFPSGEGWSYSNIGYMLLRQAIERLTGASLSRALAELVFEPMGLGATSVVRSLPDTHGLEPGFSAQLETDGEVHDVRGRYDPGWVSHGLVRSTALDTARMLDGLVGGRLLRRESVGTMLGVVPVPATHPQIRKPGYGLGLMIDRDSPYGSVAGHAGGGPGYSTAVFHFSNVESRAITIAALTNRDTSEVATKIVFAIADLLADLERS